ncbi:MAG: hypothetical protein FD126_1807 [Elusimicrobia bacterium]|nr:MAG: hypothetical protein FD126_1807 [Elusimicrobiota bacterium]
MKALLAALLASAPVQTPPLEGVALAPEGVARFTGYASAWRRSGGGLPRPVQANVPVDRSLALPASPGQAATLTERVSFAAGLEAAVRLYAVCPHGPPAGSPCPGLYYQVQLELSGAAEGFCSASLNGGDALPFPVLQCAGREKGVPGSWLGVTLHRLPL